MINLNAALRAVRTVAVVCLFSGVAMAQSVLNFTPRGQASIAITNPSPYAADVKLTLYNSSDGSPATAGVLNPVSRRIAPKGQIAVSPADIFRMKAGAQPDTWIQVTSSVTGLQGFYFVGDSRSAIDGIETATPQTAQTIPYIPSNLRGATTLIVTNPGVRGANVTVEFYDAYGRLVDDPESLPLAGHAQAVFPGRGTSARISSDVGVLATAVEDFGNSLVLINGQGPRARALRSIAPHFKNIGSTQSLLILMNPNSNDAQVRVSFFTNSGVQPNVVTVHVRGNGSVPVDWRTLSPVPREDEGWLLVESTSPASPVTGLVLVASGAGLTVLPLQSSPAERMLFSRFIDGGDLSSTLSLVGSTERPAVVTVTLSRLDGTTIARNDVNVPPFWRVSRKIRDLVPLAASFAEGFVTVQSTAPIYGTGLIAYGSGSGVGVGPQRLPPGFQASAVGASPRIVSVDITETFDGGRRLNLVGENIGNNPILYVGGKVVPVTSSSAGGYVADLPILEPGYITVKIHAGGLESNVHTVEDDAFIPRRGQAFFQKVEVTDRGLDPGRTVLVPIRHARVEVIDRFTGQVVSVAESNEHGEFLVGIPDRGGLTLRVVSRLRSADVKVLDNTAGNRPYVIARDIDDPRDTSVLEVVDTSRVSGAFNILDGVQRGNALVARADSELIPPPLTIYWSEKNTETVLERLTGGEMSTTFFKLATNTAYVLGDRDTNSDEFDDAVILHEYAHMLAGRFSRDDSPGGPHILGDILDPRVAWSEGWANFFSSAVRGTSIYLDSKRPGAIGVRYDLEDNIPPNDRQGYWSEASVQGLLWDLFDESADNGDSVQFPFASIWNAFTDLRSARFVFLPHFLEAFVARNPWFSDGLRAMAVLRSIDFQPDGRPSVFNSFPKPIAVGETRGGDVDSFTTKRTNLANSSHFYTFTTATGGSASIRLEIDGLGPNNPDANDLDLFLLDANGRRLDRSDRVIGQSEYISGIRLAPGTYYLEVRSFYTPTETNTVVFNSGHYKLTVQIQ